MAPQKTDSGPWRPNSTVWAGTGLTVLGVALLTFCFLAQRAIGAETPDLLWVALVSGVGLGLLGTLLLLGGVLEFFWSRSANASLSQAALMEVLDAIGYAGMVLGRDDRIRFANQRGLRLLGQRFAGKAATMSLRALFCEEHRGDADELLASVRAGARAGHATMDLDVIRADGTQGRFGVRILRLESDTPDGHTLWAILRDLSAHQAGNIELHEAKTSAEVALHQVQQTNRQLEECIERANTLAEAAEVANAIKTEYLTSAAQEMRAPLDAIMGMTELALASELTSRQADYLDLAKSSADRLADVLNDLLDFTQLESGRIGLDHVEFLLRDALANTLTPLAARAEKEGLAFRWSVDGEVPDALRGDPSRLRQILVNLVDNAIRFTEEGRVEVKAVRAGEEDGRICLRFDVRDTGSGISEARTRRLQEILARRAGPAPRCADGTGLWMSARLAEHMNGRIWYRTHVGAGTTFHCTVWFDQTVADASADGDGDEAEVDLAGRRVLVVEESMESRQVLENILAAWQMRVEVVPNGRQALTELRRSARTNDPFSLVLAGTEMPHMDGFALAGKIRQIEGLEQTRIVLLANSGRRGDGGRCREVRASAYLPRPVCPADLIAAMRLSLSRDVTGEEYELITRHALRERRSRLRLLLLESPDERQRLAGTILRKAGHSVVTVANLQEAVEAASEQTFDLILLDLDLPDSEERILSASRQIREARQDAPRRTPVLAMAGQLSPEQQRRCAENGIDACLIKPVGVVDLLETIAVCHRSGAEADGGGQETVRPGTTFHLDESLMKLGGDAELLHLLAADFLHDAPAMLQDLQRALAEAEPESVATAAHGMKGAVGLFASDELVDRIRQVESCAKSGDLGGAGETLAEFAQLFRRLTADLRHYVEEVAPCASS